MDEFTDAVVFAAGGWNPRFDRVVAKAVVGRKAIAIIDSNGVDGGHTDENIDHFSWIGGRWRGETSGSWGETGWGDGFAYAGGNAAPGDTVTVSFDGEEHRVEVELSGYWLFAGAGADEEELPRRVS